MEDAKKLIDRLKSKRWAMPAAGAVFSLVVAIGITAADSDEQVDEEPQADFATLIPAGFSLVNVSVHNPEAVEAMVQRYGIVDIYSKRKDVPFAKGVRMIRMPGHSLQFGVLVPEDQTARVINENAEPFHVSLQSQDKPTAFAPQPSSGRRIIVED